MSLTRALRRAPRRLLSTVAVLAASALGLAPAAPAAEASVPGPAVPAVILPADPSSQEGVTITVDSLSPEVIGSAEDVTITGTVTNSTAEPISEASLVVQVQRRTEVTVTELSSWMAGERDTSMSTVLVQPLDRDLGAGQAIGFSMTVPSDSLPLSDPEQWGPRGLEVVLTQGYSTITQDRTLLLWDAQTSVTPARVTVIVPVTASPADLQALDAQDDDALVSTITRLRGLLELADDGVVLAVDPGLLDGIHNAADEAADASEETVEQPANEVPPNSPQPDQLASSQPPEASPTPTVQATTSPGAETPAASPHPAGTALAESGDLRTEAANLDKALSAALDRGSVVALPWADADSQALAHLDEMSLLSSALDRTTSSSVVSQGAAANLVLAASALDSATLDALPTTVSTVVAYPGDLPAAEELTYTPSGTQTRDAVTVLIPDWSVSCTLSRRLVTEESRSALSDLDSRQLLRGQSAVITRQAPALQRDLVGVVERVDAFTVNPTQLGARITALTHSSWTQPQSLPELTAAASQAAQDGLEVERVELPDWAPGDGEVGAQDVADARATAARLSSVAAIFADPTPMSTAAGNVLPETVSTSWRSDPGARSTSVAQASAQADTVVEGLWVAPSSTINLIAANADMPVRIESSLDQDVSVQVHLVPSSHRLQSERDVTVTIPAHSQTSVSVPVSAVGSGNVDVTVELKGSDGTPVGTPATFHMRVRADWENHAIRFIGGLLVLTVVIGVVRTVRGGRRAVSPEEGS